METIIVYNDQLHDLIVLGKITEDDAYDILEQKIEEGYQVSFFVSSLDVQPIREFTDINEFKIWRKRKGEESRRLANLFRPKT